MGYKYFIKSHGKLLYFGLYPNNSNKIPLAISGDYTSYEDAKAGIAKLRKLLEQNSDMFMVRQEGISYYFDMVSNRYNLRFFRTKAIQHRYEVNHCINRIYKNYSAPIKANSEKDI